MIKLNEFASQQGVSVRAVQKLVKNHEEALAGLIDRRGQQGTWLSEEACDYLRERMIKRPDVVYDASKDQEIERLKKLLAEKEGIIQRKEEYIALMEAAAIKKQDRINELEDKQAKIDEKTAQLITDAEDAMKIKLQGEFNQERKKLQEALDAERQRKLSVGEAVRRVFGGKA